MIGTPADRDQHDVGVEDLRLAARGRLDGRLDPGARCLDLRHLVGEVEGEALLLQHPLELLGDLAVHAGQDAVEELDHRHLGAEPAPDRAEFEPDHARRRPRSASWGPWAGSSAPVEETTVASSISTPGSFATSEPVAMTIALVSISFSLPSSPLTTTLPGERMLPSPVNAVDLVLLEQERDAVDVGGDGLVLVLHQRGEVELRRADHHAERRQPMARLLEHFGGVQQRLRGDAADVEAGPAERLALLDHSHLQAKLGRADGADVAAGAGADDDEIIAHSVFSLCFGHATDLRFTCGGSAQR